MHASRMTLLAKPVGIAGFVLIWQAATLAAGEYWVPGPVAVLNRFRAELASGALLVDLWATGQLLIAGLLLGTLLGALMACLLRLQPRVDAMLQPFVTAAMSVPKLGLVPLLVLWFGTGWTPKLLLVAVTVFFIVFALTYAGLATIDTKLVMTARVFGATPAQVTQSVVIPSVLPFIYTGLEVALPWAVSAALVAEYLSANVGVGHGIEAARQMSDSVGIYYGIALATLLVLACNAILYAARRVSIK